MTPAKLLTVMDATWPAASAETLGPWTIRNGLGGGKRVSAASVQSAWQEVDIALAEQAMAALNQPALFLIQGADTALDAALAARGYGIVDPVVAYAAPLNAFTQAPDPMTTFPHWPPMAIALDLWAEAHIGPARVAVMARAKGPKTVILGRAQDRAAGAAFVAIQGNTAMLHALEVTPCQRRQGSAHNILRAAAAWALDNGADRLSLVVTEANENARRLYASLNMQLVGQYHYRQKCA